MSIPRIFILEDKVWIIDDLERLLKKSGYLIAGSARSGEEALAQIPRLAPDLVLVDILLDDGGGELDGIQTAQRLQEVYPVPMVFLTASKDYSHMSRVEEIGANRFVNKPFVETELIFNIKQALKSDQQAGSPPEREQIILHHPSRKDREVVKLLKDLIYFRSTGKKCLAFFSETEYYHVNKGLTELERKGLPPSFARISKREIINLQHVTSLLQSEKTVFIKDRGFVVSRGYWGGIKGRFQ
ncbi:MAG: response regulator transcription factor [Bacteroidota bacterium]